MNCTILTRSRQNLQNKDKEDLSESISVVLAKYPPNVKLERISTTGVLELGELRVFWFMRALGFL